MAQSAKPAHSAPLGLTEILSRTPLGESVYTAVKDSAVSAYARNAGVKVKTERLMVIHAGSRTIEDITRVTVVEKAPVMGANPITRIRRSRG